VLIQTKRLSVQPLYGNVEGEKVGCGFLGGDDSLHKKISTGIVVMLALALLASCKPSNWFAVSMDGEKVEINFSKEKTLTITDEAGNEEKYELNQTAAGFQNKVGYYHVEINNLSHYIIFENRKDESTAILAKQTNVASDFEDFVGEIIYMMNRDSYPEESR
jgi:hypothetical protein